MIYNINETIKEINSIKDIVLENEYIYGHLDGYKIITDEDQEILCAIENGQNCCEEWGYFWCNDNIKDFIGSKLLSIKITDKALNSQIFDKKAPVFYEGGVIFVDFVTDKGNLQFVAYNEHNGYYGHEAIIKTSYPSKSFYLIHRQIL